MAPQKKEKEIVSGFQIWFWSIVAWFLFLSYGLVYIMLMPFLLGLYLFKPKTEIFQRSNRIFYRSFLKSLPFLKLEFNNMERLFAHADCGTIIVLNHQSIIDVGFLFAFGGDLYSVSKIELKKIPFMRICIEYSGQIWVDRKDPFSIKRAMAKAAKYPMLGRQLFFFVEGTRSIDGKLQPFKKGAFQFAVRNNSAVLPVCLAGTRDFMVKGRLSMTRIPVRFTMSVGQRIEIREDLESEARKIEDLRQRSYAEIETMLKDAEER